jgi:hypothetical protein
MNLVAMGEAGFDVTKPRCAALIEQAFEDIPKRRCSGMTAVVSLPVDEPFYIG